MGLTVGLAVRGAVGRGVGGGEGGGGYGHFITIFDWTCLHPPPHIAPCELQGVATLGTSSSRADRFDLADFWDFVMPQ